MASLSLLSNSIVSIRIIESELMVEDGEPYEVRRTWKERLFTRPWRPWKATRTVVPKVPMKGGYRLADGTIIVHPAIARKMREG